MAKVYLARDLRHHRRIALKGLRPDLGAVVGIDRFQAEIQVTANLQHPNLLPLFDSGVAGELLFYVMPYVEGESLRARIDREKQLPVDEAIRSLRTFSFKKANPSSPTSASRSLFSNAGGARITQTGLSLGTPQ